MIKKYLPIGLAVGFLVSILGTAYFSYKAGVKAESARQMVAIAKAQEDERQDVKEVIKYQKEIKVVYRDRIKKIEVAQDPTGCADTLLTDMGFGLHPDSQDSPE